MLPRTTFPSSVIPTLFLLLGLLYSGVASAENPALVLRVEGDVPCVVPQELQLLVAQNREIIVTVYSDEGGGVHVKILGPTIELEQRMDEAPCEVRTGVVAAYINTTLSSLPTEQAVVANEPKKNSQAKEKEQSQSMLIDHRVAQRATLLKAALPAKGAKLRLAAYLGLGTGIGYVTLGALIAQKEKNRDIGRTLVVAGGIMAGGAIAGLLVDEDYQAVVLANSLLAGSATLLLVTGTDHKNYGSEIFAYSTFFGVGLNIAEAVYRRPISNRKLRKHAKSIASPQARSALSQQELEAIERDFSRSATVLPSWVHIAPRAIAGGLVFFDNLNSDAPDSEIYATLGAGVFLLSAFEYSIREDQGYRGFMHAVGLTKLDLSLSPNGVAMRGNF